MLVLEKEDDKVHNYVIYFFLHVSDYLNSRETYVFR